MSSILENLGICVEEVYRNLTPAALYEHALRFEPGSQIASSGALAIYSGEKTGRSPQDKRIVKNPESENDIWWGNVNIPLDESIFMINRERAIDYLNTLPRLYVFDGYAGADPNYRIKVRIVCSRAYHALFMNNMLLRPTAEELKDFGEPDYVVINSGRFPANRFTAQMSSSTSVSLDLEKREFVILGTEYAGEMKKGIFTVMNYIMPKQGVLSMHCSANEGSSGDVSLFFGLSGTGKTTLSADQNRKLIGDDEHCWTDSGVFNIEGGCYAKCIDLSEEKEPEIYRAIRFGSILENVVVDPETRAVDFSDDSITQNTRCSYPIDFIPNCKIPAVGASPSNVIFLTCDAFGVLPPVSKLTEAQAMFHFINGYTAKVAGTEQGVQEPQATFSACYGAAFMVWHPAKYAELLAEKMKGAKADAWLINTGWVGGAYGTGERISLKYTRAIIDAIHSGELRDTECQTESAFGLQVPVSCPGVPSEILFPKSSWKDPKAYEQAATNLVSLFDRNFDKFRSEASKEICDAAPSVGA